MGFSDALGMSVASSAGILRVEEGKTVHNIPGIILGDEMGLGVVFVNPRFVVLDKPSHSGFVPAAGRVYRPDRTGDRREEGRENRSNGAAHAVAYDRNPVNVVYAYLRPGLLGGVPVFGFPEKVIEFLRQFQPYRMILPYAIVTGKRS